MPNPLTERSARAAVDRPRPRILVVDDDPDILRLLRVRLEIRDPMIATSNHWPDFARLKQDPRVREILAKTGLKQMA